MGTLTVDSGYEHHLPLQDEAAGNVKVVSDEAGFRELSGSWTELWEQSESSVFQSFEWNFTWWKHYGGSKNLCILVCRIDNKVTGIMPLFCDDVRLGKLILYSSLRFVGSNVTAPETSSLLGTITYSDYLDIIARKGHEEQSCAELARFLKHALVHVDELVLESLDVSQSTVLRHLVPLFQGNGLKVVKKERASGYRVCLAASWELYLATLKKRRRYKFRRALQRLGNGAGSPLRAKCVTDPVAVMDMFEKMMDMHQEKWNKKCALGTFYEEKYRSFQREITSLFHRKGWLELHCIIDEETAEPMAIDVNYRTGKHIYAVHTAVKDDAESRRIGPGSLLLAYTLERAADSGVHVYDFLRGDESYKSAIAHDETVLADVYVASVCRVRDPDCGHFPQVWMPVKPGIIGRRAAGLLLIRRKVLRQIHHLRLAARQGALINYIFDRIRHWSSGIDHHVQKSQNPPEN